MNLELKPGEKTVRFMTNQSETSPPRRLACGRCGTEFGCDLSGPCWCMEKAYRMPMPEDGSDCLCPDCLRKAATEAASAAAT